MMFKHLLRRDVRGKTGLQRGFTDVRNHLIDSTKAGFIIFAIPIAIYFFIKWDPTFGDEGTPLGSLVVIFGYWAALYYINKYRKISKARAWQLAQFLSDNWNAELREEERLKLITDHHFMEELRSEYPEIFEDGILRMP